MSVKIVELMSIFLIFLIILSGLVYISVYSPLDTTLPPESIPISTPEIPVDKTYRCLQNSDCNTGICDEYLGVCVKPNGENCKSTFECLSTSYCSGKCIPRSNSPNYLSTNKKAGQYCPCSEGYECVNHQCYKSSGVICDKNDECVSNLCIQSDGNSFKTCSDKKSIGYTCDSNSQCSSGNCVGDSINEKLCQPTGNQPGNNGAYCGTPKDNDGFIVTCDTGLACTLDSVCTNNISNFLDGCSSNLACSNKFNCYEIPAINSLDEIGKIKLCDSESDYCSCLFNYDLSNQYPDPNTILPINNCTSSFNLSGNSCLANLDIFCTNNNNCASRNCQDVPQIYQGKIILPLENPEVKYPINGLNSMVDIIYQPLFSIPVQRIFGYTFEKIENIFSLFSNKIFSISNNVYLNLRMNNPSYILEQILDADATIFNNIPFILTACIVSNTSGNKYIRLFTMSETGLLSDYGNFQISIPSSYTLRLSVVASRIGNLITSEYLLSLATSSSISLYYNGNLLKNPFGSNNPKPNTITLNHGLIYNSSDSDQLKDIANSYRLISYIDSSGYLQFTKPIDNTIVQNNGYSSLKYPYDYGNDYLVSAFAICNIDPTIIGYSNIILASSIKLSSGNRSNIIYYISDGVESVIPGYPDANGMFLMTSEQFYFYSPKSCLT